MVKHFVGDGHLFPGEGGDGHLFPGEGGDGHLFPGEGGDVDGRGHSQQQSQHSTAQHSLHNNNHTP